MGARRYADLRVVVLTYGGGNEHGPLVESVHEQGVPRENVALVHNPSTDGRQPAGPPGGELICMQSNLGYAGAMNAGLRAVLGEGAGLVLLLTHDLRLRPGAIGELLDAADRAPGFGILGPVLLSRSDDRPWSYGGLRLRSGWVGHRSRRPESVDGNGVAKCDWIDGAAMLVRAEVLSEVGLFDERYFMYAEETDLCLRAQAAGWDVGVALDAVAQHEPGVPNRPGAYGYLATRNGLEIARRTEGARGFVRFVGFTLYQAWHILRALVGPRSKPGVRRQSRDLLVGIWFGAGAFLLRRWGPPPRWLPGLGDLEVTDGRQGQDDRAPVSKARVQ